MTVQQERPTAVADRTTAVPLPTQRAAEHDAVPPTTPATAAPRPLRGWGSEHDRSTARMIMLMMSALSVYITVMLVIAIRVWD